MQLQLYMYPLAVTNAFTIFFVLCFSIFCFNNNTSFSFLGKQWILKILDFPPIIINTTTLAPV